MNCKISNFYYCLNYFYLCLMMNSLQEYCVAGFCFTAEGLPFEPVNLLPFKAQPSGREAVFALKVVPELQEADGTLLFKTPETSGFPVITIYTREGGYIFEMQPVPDKPAAGRMTVTQDFKGAELNLTGTDDHYAIDSAMMLMFTFSTARKGALVIHSSVVTNGGSGYLFLGRSGTGKSTHSRLWMENIPGTELLNDDNPVIRLMKDGSVRVYGTPWSGKTPCYKAQDAPVGAIVSLSQAQHNQIQKLPVIKAYAALMESASSFRPFKDLADGWHHTMEGICAAVPFYHLECLPDKEAALLCYSTVKGRKTLPNEVLLEDAGKLLAEGREVCITPKGNSMLPFIRNGEDSVTLKKLPGAEVGDIVLARLGDRHYVLHRVIRARDGALTLMGDGNISGTEQCLQQDIMGTAVRINDRKPGKGALWRTLKPIRRYLLAIYRRLK